MKESFYGRFQQTHIDDDTARHVEDIRTRGYTVIPNLWSADELGHWRQRIDTLYESQEKEFGKDFLAAIQDLDVCRGLLIHDFDFIRLATQPRVLAVVSRLLGEYFILGLQNSIINRPGTQHHQSSWHRDLPYQNYVISRPLAINALFAIDEFSPATGCTQVVPFTHQTETLPSDDYIAANRIDAAVPAGSAIVFDSMLFHRAGNNTSNIVRRAVNHLYTVPIIKQQYDIPRALGKHPEVTADLARLLGYTTQVPEDDSAWRRARYARSHA